MKKRDKRQDNMRQGDARQRETRQDKTEVRGALCWSCAGLVLASSAGLVLELGFRVWGLGF